MVAEQLSLHTQSRYDVPAFHPSICTIKTERQEMDKNTINKLFADYEHDMFIGSINDYNRSMIINVIEYGIKNGFFKEVEQKNSYTFGGVTINLTNTELANVMALLRDKQKIAAIKSLRTMHSDRETSLKEAKCFADHLSEIIDKMALTVSYR